MKSPIFENKKEIIIFSFCSALWLAACASLWIPQIQLLIIEFAEAHIVADGKVDHPELITQSSFLGFAFYPALATYSGYLWRTNPFSLLTLSGVMLVAVIVISKWLLESILLDQSIQGVKVFEK
jgi:hypothetical protein